MKRRRRNARIYGPKRNTLRPGLGGLMWVSLWLALWGVVAMIVDVYDLDPTTRYSIDEVLDVWAEKRLDAEAGDG